MRSELVGELISAVTSFGDLNPPFGARLVEMSSYFLGISIDTSLETGVTRIKEREVVAMFVYLRDCGPVVLLFFSSFGFELIVASVEFA
ncbi:hypothetical protein F511_13764 [Dorcoceras hygrometricum]|uniref:Uncharacterized protein n=1 Tax=Dorcoceras hygrometricum TaxID=472368 RepID=A0A2Z7CZ69_9LAMI|nr:hypothetical protein F511_13764 [Dorcoceras hygrometricum]